MDLGTMIIGAILLAICIIPFIIIRINRKKKEKQLIQNLNALANEINCQITRHEIFRDLIIGMDEETKTLFFIKNDEDKFACQYIKLKEIQKCSILKTNTEMNADFGNGSIIEKLELSLTYKGIPQSEILLQFYNRDQNNQLMGEIELIEKWNKSINELID